MIALSTLGVVYVRWEHIRHVKACSRCVSHSFSRKICFFVGPISLISGLLLSYYHTGARTSELADAVVKDFQVRSRKLVLKNHKRSRTMNEPEVRKIVLNDEAFSILQLNCRGKGPNDPIFARRNGKPWDNGLIDERFRMVRKLAEVREAITIYDFRHLWISEALMAGVDVFTAARMAGTSVTMIEQTYRHLRGTHLEDAQRRLDQARSEERKGKAG